MHFKEKMYLPKLKMKDAREYYSDLWKNGDDSAMETIMAITDGNYLYDRVKLQNQKEP